MSRIISHIELAFIPALQVAVPGDWVDITPYVRSISGRKGRDHELIQTQAAEVNLALKNTDRRFDPTNVAGPYYPDINVGVRLRIRPEYKGVFYPQFHGYVKAWDQTWPPRPIYQVGDAEAEVRAVDAFELFSLLPVSTYVGQVIADAPVNYFRCDDQGGDLTDAMGSASNLTVTYGLERPAWGVTDYWGLPRAIQISSLAGTYEESPTGSPTKVYNSVGGDLTVEFITGGNGAAGTGIVVDNGNYLVGIGGTAPNQFLSYNHYTAGAGYHEQSNSGALFNGAPGLHHHVITRAGRVLTFYTDGIQTWTDTLASDIGSVDAFGAPAYFCIGGPEGFHVASYNGLLSHVALYDYALTPTQVANHHSQIAELIPAGVVSDQLKALLATVPWPTSLENIDTSVCRVADWIPDGTNVLDAMEKLAFDTEQGLLFMTGDGVVRFVSHPNMEADIIPAATFGDLDPELGYEDLVVRFDDTQLATTVGVTRDGGARQEATSAIAEATFGPHTLELSSRNATDDDAYVLAAGLLGERDTVNLRIETLKARSGS